MAIISITPYYAGQVDQLITRWKLISTDSLATVTSTGYLNSSNLMGYTVSPNDIFDVIYSYTGSINIPGTGTYVELLPTITHVNAVSVITLNQVIDSGNIPLPTLPVVSGDLVVWSGTAGNVADTSISSTNPIFLGNVQAGASGTAGVLKSYPATASKGYLELSGVANTGNTATIISNDAMGQASTVNIPDPANATGQFLIGATQVQRYFT